MSASEDFEKRRNELLQLNIRSWDGDNAVFSTSGKLDTSLKKNTAFIKKLRTVINKENEKSILDGIRTISLEKYLTEISAALCESLNKVSKSADVQSSVEIISALHQRFATRFTPFVELYFANSFVYPKEKIAEKELSDFMIRNRNLLKLAMELTLVGVFRTIDDISFEQLPQYLAKLKAAKKNDVPIIIPMTKHIMSYEYESGITLPLMVSFINRFGFMFLDPNSPRYEENYSVLLRKLFKSYTQNAILLTESLFKTIQKNKTKATNISMKTGKLVEDLEERIKEMEARFAEFNAFCELACPMMEMKKPELVEESNTDDSAKITLTQQNKQKNHIWPNEETRAFYEDFPSLESLVPKETLESVNSKIQPQDVKGTKFSEIIARLYNAETAKEVDAIVTDFWIAGLSNKASRNRLSKHIMELTDVTKFRNIARFWKINQEYFETNIQDMITRLDKSFRFQIHHEAFTEKDIIIFAEMIKFKMIPTHVVIHKIRTLILNIEVNNNIDLLSLMFEGCSRVLLYDPEYAEYTKDLIKLLVEMYKVKRFSHTDKYAVKVFLLSLNPPKEKKVEIAELSLEEQFMEYMIKVQMNEKTWRYIALCMKEMNWNDPVVYNRIRIILSNPADISYTNIKFLAKLLKALVSDKNQALRTYVIDQLVEDITYGLEVNNYQSLRPRISQCAYFSELINLNIIPKTLLVPMIYKIICFGHPNSNPSRNQYCEIDEPTDHFRIRLVSEILSNISWGDFGRAFLKDIKTSLAFFNYYIMIKEQPISVDLNTKVNEAFLNVNKFLHKFKNFLDRAEDYESAVMNLNDVVGNTDTTSSEQYDDVDTDTNLDDDANDEDEFENEDDEEDDDEDALLASVMTKSSGVVSDDEYDDDDDDDNVDEDEAEDEDSEDDDENDENAENDTIDGDIVDTDDDEEDDDNDDDGNLDTNAVFEQMEIEIALKKATDESIQEGMNNSKVIKGFLSDKIGTPTALLHQTTMNSTEDTQSQDSGMKFTLMSRSGKKINPHSIVIPENNKVAVNFTNEQKRIRDEKDKIKQFVLKSHSARNL